MRPIGVFHTDSTAAAGESDEEDDADAAGAASTGVAAAGEREAMTQCVRAAVSDEIGVECGCRVALWEWSASRLRDRREDSTMRTTHSAQGGSEDDRVGRR